MDTASDKMDTGLGEVESNGYQHAPVSSIHSGSLPSGMSRHVSQQMRATVKARSLEPASNNLGSEGHLMLNDYSVNAGNQNNNTMWQQPFLVANYSSGTEGAMFDGLANRQLSVKRKSTAESLTESSASQKLPSPNKRMANMEHRPWLQQLSVPSNGSLQTRSTSASPGTASLSTPGRKMMQLEPVSSKSGKQMSTRKQPMQVQAPRRACSDSTESVRSKMKESLAAALALVQNKDEPQKGTKHSESRIANPPEKSRENLHPAGSASAAAGPVSALTAPGPVAAESERASTESVSFAEGFVQDVQAAMQNHSDSVTSDTKQEHQFDNVFPQDDVPFSDNIFVKDDLLQGNGLAWVLEPVTELGQKAENELAEIHKSDNEKMERIGNNNVQDPQLLAFKIELELYKLFGGVNKKYKEKGRSLLFNLKDRNNPELRERVMSGEIPPERLCTMTAEELASKELSQWRQAKAEEMAQMVVLPDTEVDIRRLVKKTHKGEFQVEVEPLDSGVMEVSSGVSSVSHPRSKVKETKSWSLAEKHGEKDEAKESRENKMGEDQDGSMQITIPPGESIDPMQGLTVDDEMKDANFLPPIVSLDEFMESLNSEPPFENLPKNAGQEKPAAAARVKSEPNSDQRSLQQVAKDRVNVASKQDKTDASLSKPVAQAKSCAITANSAATSVATVKVEQIWEGSLQFGVSAVAPVIGVFKSGEKSSTSAWPVSMEVKGRVRLEAFQKFVQELPLSRSRAVMVIHLVSKQGLSESERDSLSEAAESYVSDGRVGFAEPTPAVELYLCPPHQKTLDILTSLIPKDQQDAFNSINSGLIGVIVWRRSQSTSSPLSPGSHHKNSSKRPHSGFRRHQEKSTTMNDVNFASRDSSRPHHVARSVTNATVDDDDDDDVPPGFGPVAGRDDDDLPEFNFSAGGQLPGRAPHQPRSVDQVRALIHKYGKPSEGAQTWKANDDDDDDIPEWQPQAPASRLHPSTQSVPKYQAYVVTHGGTAMRPNSPVPPAIQNVAQPGSWWMLKPGGGRQYGPSLEPRSRGF